MEEDFRRELQVTADGSHTLFVPAMDEHYHSVNGAVQESMHVFIGAGLHRVAEEKEEVRILEIGFGTGLNAFLTLRENVVGRSLRFSENALPQLLREGATAGLEAGGGAVRQRRIVYYSVELYPLEPAFTESLNYGEGVWPGHTQLFRALHRAPWDEAAEIAEGFVLHKIRGDACVCPLPLAIDLLYFDAFAPDKQPEMWTLDFFRKLYALTSPGGILVTYCAKGEVRRRLQEAGFQMERLAGPPGKRHMLFGRK